MSVETSVNYHELPDKFVMLMNILLLGGPTRCPTIATKKLVRFET